MLLINVLLAVFTADTRSITPSYASRILSLGDLRISYVRLGVLAIALLLAALLWLFLNRTRIGNAIRATSFDQEAAQLVGVEIKDMFPLTFGIGAAIAGAIGPLLAMTTSFSPVLGDTLTMKAFVVVVLGGLGSVPGAVIGGMALGVAEHLSTPVFGSGYQEAMSFVALIAVLVLRPSGFLGKKFYAEVKG
jgi:branched-chain amino acid transport system permease protein